MGRAPADSLEAIAARKGLRFGSAIPWQPGSPPGLPVRDPGLCAADRSAMRLVVAENEMKWQRLRRRPTCSTFAPFDTIVAWAERNGLAVRGHNLLWHQPKWQPKWLNAYDFGSRPRAEANGC